MTDRHEDLPKQPGARSRIAWILGGAAVILVGFLLRNEPTGFANLLFPSGSWMILRGLL